MGKIIVHGEGDKVIVRDTSESPPEHDETNAAIRKEYRKHDEKNLHDGKVERLESEKKKKIIFPILLAAVLLIVAIGAALYIILN